VTEVEEGLQTSNYFIVLYIKYNHPLNPPPAGDRRQFTLLYIRFAYCLQSQPLKTDSLL